MIPNTPPYLSLRQPLRRISSSTIVTSVSVPPGLVRSSPLRHLRVPVIALPPSPLPRRCRRPIVTVLRPVLRRRAITLSRREGGRHTWGQILVHPGCPRSPLRVSHGSAAHRGRRGGGWDGSACGSPVVATAVALLGLVVGGALGRRPLEGGGLLSLDVLGFRSGSRRAARVSFAEGKERRRGEVTRILDTFNQPLRPLTTRPLGDGAFSLQEEA